LVLSVLELKTCTGHTELQVARWMDRV